MNNTENNIFQKTRAIINEEWKSAESIELMAEKLKNNQEKMSREEALIRLIAELPKAG